MGKTMYEERTYERKQEIEIRAARGGNVQSWVRAKIDSLTSKGAHVTLLGSGRTTHVGWRDMRKLGATTAQPDPQEANVAAPARPTFSNPVLSTEAAGRLKAEVEQVKPSPPLATVTAIRQQEKEQEVMTENQQRLVNVSKPRKLANAPRLPVASNALVAGLLKNAREQEGLTLNDLAELLEVGPITVSRIERGESSPDDDLLMKYHEELGLDLELLLLSRDKPGEAHDYKPAPKAPPPPPAPTFPSPKNVRSVTPGLVTSSPAVEPTAKTKPTMLDMEDFFEFCDRMELICPQPSEPALRKRWRELAQGLFDLRSKL